MRWAAAAKASGAAAEKPGLLDPARRLAAAEAAAVAGQRGHGARRISWPCYGPATAPALASPLAQLWQVIIALVITVLARVAVNVNRLSMHDFYRWRLADAFAITRQAAQEQDPLEAAQAVR